MELLTFHFPLKGKTEWCDLGEVLGELKYNENLIFINETLKELIKT